jgi:hypothetical protein
MTTSGQKSKIMCIMDSLNETSNNELYVNKCILKWQIKESFISEAIFELQLFSEV